MNMYLYVFVYTDNYKGYVFYILYRSAMAQKLYNRSL